MTDENLKFREENTRKRKNKSFSIVEKVSAINEFEQGEKISFLCAKYEVPRRTLRNWIDTKEKIKEQGQTYGLDENIKRIKKSPFNDISDALYIWFDQCVKNGIFVTGPLIMAKAKELHEELKIEKPFNASEGWLANWKKKYKIQLCSQSSEKFPDDYSAAHAFKTKLSKFIDEEQLDLCQIFNADETSLHYKELPKISSAETKSANIKINKDRVTIMTCINADASLKFPMVIIGKLSNSIENYQESLPVYYASNRRTWMTSVIFEKWFKEEFVTKVKTFLEEKNLPVKAVLLVNHAPCHFSAETLQVDNISVMYFPPNTSLIQPMKQGLFEDLKKYYRSIFMDSMIHAQKIGKNRSEFLKSIDLKHVIYWLIYALNNVKDEMILNCWKNILSASDYPCSIPNLSNISNAEILNKVQRLNEFQNIDEKSVENWLTADEEEDAVPSVNDLLEMVWVDDVPEDVNDSNGNYIDPNEAVIAADKLLDFFRQNKVLPAATMTTLVEIKQAAVKIAISK